MPQRICLTCGRAFRASTARNTRCSTCSTPKVNRYGRPWRRLKIEILRRDGFVCRYCGREADSVDHVRPVSKGGTDAPNNLVACCGSCNSSKRDRSLVDWAGTD